MSLFVDSDDESIGTIEECDSVPLLANTIDDYINEHNSYIGYGSSPAITINPKDGISKMEALAKLKQYCYSRGIHIILCTDWSEKKREHYHGIVTFMPTKKCWCNVKKSFQVFCNRHFGHIKQELIEEANGWKKYISKHKDSNIIVLVNRTKHT